ncbi:MAG TPA: DUF2267 domain-containing protein [Beijerinckiaceae bacterium]|nr:DUF2267 domain-containing protein [Beijerinckiaceae bacterium]
MDELIARISQASGLDPAKSEQAVVAILSFLRAEGPSAEVDQLFAAIPGAEAAVTPEAGADGGGGDLGGLMGMMGGGGLMGLAGKLSGLGLSMGDMQSVGHELFAFGRENAGEDVVGQIAGAVPGLSQFI